MKIFLKSNQKYFKFERKMFYQYIYLSKKGTIISFFVNENFSNNRKFLLGNRCKYKKILNSISSKIVFSFSDILTSNTWENLSSRTIRTFLFYPSFPLEIFFSLDYTLIVILTKKNVLIYNIFDVNLLHNIPMGKTLPIALQLIKGFPLLVIFQKYGGFDVLNYQKGYFIKKLGLLGSNFFPDGILNCRLNYCLKKSRSSSLNTFSDKIFFNFNLLGKYFSIRKKNGNECFFGNIKYNGLHLQNIILMLGINFYILDFFSGVVIFK